MAAQPHDNPAVRPRIITPDVSGLTAFMRTVLGATGTAKDGAPAEMRLGGSIIMVSDGGGLRPSWPAFLYVYVDDVDSCHDRALAAGARSVESPEMMPWGDRRATVEDRWGNWWQIATRM